MDGFVSDDYKFSVLMSVYDKENPEYFNLALESVLINQSLCPDELVMVVDGPISEGLQSVIKFYEQKYREIVQVYQLERNLGLGQALKFGMTKCRYNYVARADSDDICAPDRFKVQLDCFRDDPKLDILGSYIEEFDSDYRYPSNRKHVPLVHADICRYATFRNPLNHMTVMFKKDKVLSCGSYQHLPYLEDYYLWVRAIVNGCRLGNVAQYLVCARVGNGMLERRGNKKYIASWKVLSKYMLDNKLISYPEYFRNIASIHGFIYMPPVLRKFAYRFLLRNIEIR